MYSYETKGNGLTLEIFKGKRSVGFYQDESASFILRNLEACETDEDEQEILESYATE